jgi:hypothetical protein
MKWSYLGALLAGLIVVAMAAMLLGSAKAPPLATAGAATVDLAPSERHRKVARLVSGMIERSHYRQAPVNDRWSSTVTSRPSIPRAATSSPATSPSSSSTATSSTTP